MMKDSAYQGPLRLAHRGVVQAAPENTIGAFVAARDMGLEGLEIDVRLSRDGEVVVIHDGNLTRLTLGHPTLFSYANIADLSWEQLAKVELPFANHLLEEEPPYGSEHEFLAIRPEQILGQESGRSYPEALAREPRMAKLMRLEEFLRWLEAEAPGMLAEIEVKAPGAALPIFSLLEQSPVADRCIVFSGQPKYIEELQKTAAAQGKPKGVRLGANIRCLTPEIRQSIPAMDLYEVGMNAEHIPPEDVRWLAERDIRVFANLGDYPAWWSRLYNLGVAGLKTNYAAAFTAHWKQMQE